MTIRQNISDIRSANKMISADATITDRAIMSLSNTCAIKLIKQQTDKRKLFASPNLFTHMPCIPMIKVPLAECCEYTSERKVARSKNKLPKIAEGPYGLLIQQIASVDKTSIFTESTVRRYANSLKLRPQPKGNYYWIYDNYIYVSNEDTKSIDGYIYFEEEPTSDIICPDKDCDCAPKAKSDCDPCKNPFDRDFRCPGYLLSDVRKMVELELLQTYFSINKDLSSNDVDEQRGPVRR